MLLQNPQLAYALLQAQIVMKIVDPQVAMVRNLSVLCLFVNIRFIFYWGKVVMKFFDLQNAVVLRFMSISFPTFSSLFFYFLLKDTNTFCNTCTCIYDLKFWLIWEKNLCFYCTYIYFIGHVTQGHQTNSPSQCPQQYPLLHPSQYTPGTSVLNTRWKICRGNTSSWYAGGIHLLDMQGGYTPPWFAGGIHLL